MSRANGVALIIWIFKVSGELRLSLVSYLALGSVLSTGSVLNSGSGSLSILFIVEY